MEKSKDKTPAVQADVDMMGPDAAGLSATASKGTLFLFPLPE